MPAEVAAPRRLEVHLSYVCGQRCRFCSESGRMARWRRNPLSAREVADLLVRRRSEGFDHVTFTGGEPSAHPLLPEVLRAAKALGYQTYLTTNGGRFSDERYAERALPWLDEMCVSLHGPTPETHDAQTRSPGSFARAMAALALAAGRRNGPRLLTNTVVTRENWEHLMATARLIAGTMGVSHSIISNLAPEGRGTRGYAARAVRLELWRELVPRVADVFATAGVTARFFGLPLCALGGSVELANDAHFSPRVTMERRRVGGRPGLTSLVSLDASRGRRQAPRCGNCAQRDICAGVFARYLEVHGDAELVPTGRKI